VKFLVNTFNFSSDSVPRSGIPPLYQSHVKGLPSEEFGGSEKNLFSLSPSESQDPGFATHLYLLSDLR